MAEKKNHPNKVCGYLKPKNDALFRGYVSMNNIGCSEAINIMVKDFFQRLPEDDKMKYITNAKSKREQG